jgi:enolase
LYVKLFFGNNNIINAERSFTMPKQFKITDITAIEILDSRANPTVEAHISAEVNGFEVCGYASVPSGASTGKFEAMELRDGGGRYCGRGVLSAVNNIKHIIAPKLIGVDVTNQTEIDRIMLDLDGSPNKSRLGANATLAVSLAAAVTAAKALNIPLYRYLGGFNANTLPLPMMNIMNGGRHADNTVDFQEFMIMPVGANSFGDGVRMCCEVYHSLKSVLKSKGLSTGVGDEGGFAPDLATAEEVMDNIIEAVELAGYGMGNNFMLAMDAAASELYGENGLYRFEGESRAKGIEVVRSSEEMVEYYEKLCEKYPIISIEDGLAEEDWSGWQLMTKRLGHTVQLVGDDLFVTNTERIKKGIQLNTANSVLIKVNQIGTLTEAFEAVKLAQRNNMTAVISHRSGETEDTTIADIAVALNCGQIKTGAPARIDRGAKYNRLLRIEKELGKSAVFDTSEVFYNIIIS